MSNRSVALRDERANAFPVYLDNPASTPRDTPVPQP